MPKKNDHTDVAPRSGNNVVVFDAQYNVPCLSELYTKDRNIRLISQLVVLSGFIVLVSSIVSDSIEVGRFSWTALDFMKPLEIRTLAASLLAGLALHVASIVIFPVFKLWARLRSSCSTTVVDVVFIILYSVAIVGSFVYMLWICSKLNAPHYVNFTLATEQIRLCMKTYSFVRENAYKVLYPWHKDDSDGPAVWYAGQMSPSIGSFRQYLYFLVAPTLLYRDHYPRSKRFNLKSLMIYFFLIVLGHFFCQHVFGLVQLIDDFHWRAVLSSFIKGVPLGVVYGVCTNIFITHSWMNFWAELTGFGDRRFYDDWWLSNTFAEYYRKWNTIPYHFNHQYIYKDIRKVINSKYLALFLMFFASSAYHEYIIGVGFGYAVPVVTLFFAGIGPIVVVLRFNGTLPVVASLCLGMHLLIWVQSMENKARYLCPREETFIDLFYPRLVECIVKHSM